MNRREMLKAVAAVVVGGPAALEAAQRAEALRLYRPPVDLRYPIPHRLLDCGGNRYGKTLPSAIEFARAVCK